MKINAKKCEANIPQIEINSETIVAMKVDLSIPCEKLNAMKRYVKIAKVQNSNFFKKQFIWFKDHEKHHLGQKLDF